MSLLICIMTYGLSPHISGYSIPLNNSVIDLTLPYAIIILVKTKFWKTYTKTEKSKLLPKDQLYILFLHYIISYISDGCQKGLPLESRQPYRAGRKYNGGCEIKGIFLQYWVRFQTINADGFHWNIIIAPWNLIFSASNQVNADGSDVILILH